MQIRGAGKRTARNGCATRTEEGHDRAPSPGKAYSQEWLPHERRGYECKFEDTGKRTAKGGCATRTQEGHDVSCPSKGQDAGLKPGATAGARRGRCRGRFGRGW